jgi:hypothetical protein
MNRSNPPRNGFCPLVFAFQTPGRWTGSPISKSLSLSSRYEADHCGSAVGTGRKPFGRIEMAKAPERMQRRHVREKATIDHLVQDVYKPKPPEEQHASHSPTTSTGLPVEDQVRKEWDPRKGGLPTF